MDVYTQGVPESKRRSIEILLRATMGALLKEPTEISFRHTDSLGSTVDISVPKLNGEMRVQDFEFVETVGVAALRRLRNGPLTCRMRETHTSWSRW